MPTDLLIAQTAEAAADGHGHFRVHGPARALARLPGVTAVDCEPDHRRLPTLHDEADVLVLHGLHPDYLPTVHRRRARGQVTVFEAADDYLDVLPWADGSAGWLDRTVQDQFWQLVAAADAVQTGSDVLAAKWAAKARRVFVFPNHLDDVPPLPPSPPARPLTVGWAGSVTHLPDWLSVAPVLERWVANRPGVRLAVMTDEAARDYVRQPPDRYHFRPRGTLAEYDAFLGELDVAVVPLLPGAFNRGRTALKVLELAARGVPGVFADAGPYRTAVEPGRTGLLFRTADELVRHLDAVADDPALRAAVRREAHARLAGRRLADHIGQRLAAYRDLLGGPGRGVTLPPELVADAVADGRYLRLPAGDPELALRRAVRLPPEEAARELEAILAAHPFYHAAARHLGRVLNDLGRFADAAAVLESTRAARPDSPTVLTELARSRISLNDAAAARAALDRAVAANPAYAPAWGLLLRVAGPDAAALADRARRNQPANHLADLAALKFAADDGVPARLAEWLTAFGPTFHPEERPYAAAAFGQAAAARLDLASAAAAGVLAVACGCFPDSPRLADLHGEALRLAGRPGEALNEFARALRLTRAARTTELERSAGRERFWQVAEYAVRHHGG